MTLRFGFCTTCMGRLIHLRETLPHNLAAAQPYRDFVHFVLLDYNSRDGLEEWLKANVWDETATGWLSVYSTKRPAMFHPAHAKNVVHLLSPAEILVNLDADNFLSSEYLEFLFDRFRRDRRQVFYGRHSGQGRIAIDRREFLALGGYDEDLHGYGGEDTDLVARAKRGPKLLVRRVEEYDLYIEHTDDLRIANMAVDDLVASQFANRARKRANLNRRRFAANVGRSWGCEILKLNYDDHSPIIVGETGLAEAPNDSEP